MEFEPGIKFPIRINRYLALRQFCSRREADKLIKQGQVTLNGKTAELGMQVKEGDEVFLRQGFKKMETGRVYLAFNKPVGIVTHNPEKGQKSIRDIFRYKTRVYPVGRLDKDSFGLIILTNDGRVTGKLLSPEFQHEKEYAVKVDKAITEAFLKKMAKGINIADYITKPASIRKTGEKEFKITLTEGKNRQIRRMCLAMGYTVLELKRLRILNIELGNLKPGEHREITREELKSFLDKIGLSIRS
ncbi:MAG: pseudouridine synthase [Minisyncoccia bacterium]